MKNQLAREIKQDTQFTRCICNYISQTYNQVRGHETDISEGGGGWVINDPIEFLEGVISAIKFEIEIYRAMDEEEYNENK